MMREMQQAMMAIESLTAALQLKPDDAAERYIDAAECLMHLGRREQAFAVLTAASGAQREDTLARLARFSFHQNLWDESIAVSRRNVELHPKSANARWNLAYVLNECWHMEEALAVLQQAESLAPMPFARSMRASMAARRGDADTALTGYLALAQEPQQDAVMAATAAMCSLYSDHLGAQEVADLHQRLFAPLGVGARSPQSFVRGPLAGRRLRLGLVSGDFHGAHPVNQFMQPLLRAFDRSRFELFVYFNGNSYDEQTAQARSQVEHWVDAGQLGNPQLAERIDADGIDLLLDLAGPTNPLRIPLFAQRAAPVQATYLGYPGSSGVPNMDWIVGDAVVTPEGCEALYSERIARLSGTVFCFAPEADYPYPEYLPAHAKRPLTFGSFNNVPKLTPRTLALWAQVLAAVPDSRLLLKAPSFGDGTAVREFSTRLQALGVDMTRVEFRGPTPLADMMAEYADVDIALDPLPYNGGTTSLQALWMGVPVITLAGPRYASRMGASFMAAASLEDWVAKDEAAYVRIAVQKVKNRKALLTLKKGLRERLQAAPAWNLVLHIHSLEDALQQMCEEAERQSSALSVTPGNSTSV